MVGELMEEKRRIDALALKAMLLCPLTAFFLPMWVAVSSVGGRGKWHTDQCAPVCSGQPSKMAEGGMLTFHHNAMQKPQKVCLQGKIYG